MADALRDGAVIEATIARQALHLLRASDALRDPDPGLRHEIRDGVAGLTDRLEARFQQIDPDGPWQAAISSIRERL